MQTLRQFHKGEYNMSEKTGSFRKHCLLWMLLIMTAVLGCTVNASAAKLNKKEASVYIGSKITLKVTGGQATSWKSSKKNIASVSSSGVVKGRRKGTACITCTVEGKTLRCYVTVRRKQVSRYLPNSIAKVWRNMIGAVESGGQVYGDRDYAAFSGPLMGAEVAVTAGAFQEYGENLRNLLLRIQTEYPYTFKKYDKAGIAGDLKRSWDYYVVSPGSAKANSIVNIINCKAGRTVQDIRIVELLDESIDLLISEYGITDLRSLLFMAECHHLGGSGPLARVIGRASNRNKISQLRKSLYQDQYDTSNDTQIGDAIFKTRHDLMYQWICQYIQKGTTIKAS